MISAHERGEQQQQQAIVHQGSPARLLAGPGTGKTYALTERVIRLVQDPDVLPTNILALTFTRAAAQELQGRVREAAGENEVAPRVSTLHSFALRQLLRNTNKVDLPMPLRIADDWEERNIIEPDIRDAIAGKGVLEVRGLFRKLASDWETLNAESDGWEQEFQNPQFLGAWGVHRGMYAYTLRAELVYKLKKATEQNVDFSLEGPPRHLLVDEYQDLNPCDISIVQHIRKLGAELYVAGDDDQSIYAFRNAYPLGIRGFATDIEGAVDLRLEVCRRCAPKVVRLADFVIRQEVGRIPKQLLPLPDRAPGKVNLSAHKNQHDEAEFIAKNCARNVAEGIRPSEILILLRSDRNKAFSRVLESALRRHELPVHSDAGGEKPFDSHDGRRMLSLLRLVADPKDSLSWRALIDIDRNRIGKRSVKHIEDTVRNMGGTFGEMIVANISRNVLGEGWDRVRRYSEGVLAECSEISRVLDVSERLPDERAGVFLERLKGLELTDIKSIDDYQTAHRKFCKIAESTESPDVGSVLRIMGSTLDDDEQVIDSDAVNILSMHKAKGLGKHTVFIAAAEDEYIPGSARNEIEIDEERRLLYVSISRAQEQLYITYSNRRTGQQQHTGRRSGSPNRSLTRFLRNSYLVPGKRKR